MRFASVVILAVPHEANDLVAEELRQQVGKYLAAANTPALPGELFGLMVPHAGYAYSGQICADAFRLASRYSFERVVILGTNHTASDFQGISIVDAGEFETPLGRIPVDEEIARKLLSIDKSVTADSRVHAREHSIEVILPFIQKVFPKAKIVPVIIGAVLEGPIVGAVIGLIFGVFSLIRLAIKDNRKRHIPLKGGED